MKTTKTIETKTCDFCGADDCYYKCLRCGKDVCYECKKKAGIEYQHSICCSGSGDGFYCHECDKADKSPLHAAYQEIRSLRNESDGFWEDFKKRSDAAEARLKKLQK